MKKQKYGNKIIVVDGMKFHSVREYERWIYLCHLAQGGVISELRRQVEFDLIPAQYEEPIIGSRGGMRKGKCIERAVKYIADFVYLDENGGTVVEDSKGYHTKDYIIKKKLMLWLHGIRIKEV